MVEARKFITTTYQLSNARIDADPGTFEFSARYQHHELFGVDLLRHTGNIHLTGGTSDYLYLAEVIKGRLRVATEDGMVCLQPGSAVMATVDEPRRMSWSDLHVVAVRLDAFEVRRLAAELNRVPLPAVRLRLRYSPPSARTRHWSAAVRYVVQGVLDNPLAMSSELARRECFRLLATTALDAFRQPGFSVGQTRTQAATPATIRRAVEFIEANADKDITTADIARVARLSIRGTNAAFHRHLDTSPAAYLRRVRLAAVHRDLIAADPTSGARVADISARWGFLHPGRFAAAYRDCFGVLPSETLNH